MTDRPIFFFPRVLPFNYRAAILERLNDRLDGRLIVCSGMPPSGSSLRTLVDTHEMTGYRTVHLRNYWLGEEVLHAQPFGRAFRAHGRPSVIVAEESPRSITQPLLMGYARLRGVPRVLWGHFSSNNRRFDPEAHWMDRYRLWMAQQAEACICYTDRMADLLRPYLPEEHVFVARNTLDTDTLFALYRRLNEEGRESVRERIGLPIDEPVALFIGRLIAAKGTDMLLDVFRELSARNGGVLVVIGDGPERPSMAARATSQGLNIRFLGAMPEWETSAPYLYAADVMLQPGYLGLSVNHAFVFGLPVVSQAAPPGGPRFHSPEVHFVEHGSNGMLSAHGELDAMVDAVRYVLARRERFSTNALTYAHSHLRIDTMVDGMEAAIRYAEGQQAMC